MCIQKSKHAKRHQRAGNPGKKFMAKTQKIPKRKKAPDRDVDNNRS